MSADVRCDLCEQQRDPVWVFRSDHFAIRLGDDTNDYPQDAEWGVCQSCKDDILADRQTPILDRRRASTAIRYGGQHSPRELDELDRVLGILVLTFLSCRQKTWPGRPFSIVDSAAAIVDVTERGGRRH